MEPLTDARVRASLINCSASQRGKVTLPDLRALVWDELDYLGWRDGTFPQRGYLVTVQDGKPLGVVVRAAATTASRKSMCSLCHTVHNGTGVAFFSAAKAGKSGRAGNTVGTYACADLRCSHHLRHGVPGVDRQPDAMRPLDERIDGALTRLDGFLAAVSRQ